MTIAIRAITADMTIRVTTVTTAAMTIPTTTAAAFRTTREHADEHRIRQTGRAVLAGDEERVAPFLQILGYRVDSYALFDVEVFVELIDAMGGIDFDVPVDMDYDDPGQDLSIHVQKGYQHLNGYQTMGVFRFRNTYANGDIGSNFSPACHQ